MVVSRRAVSCALEGAGASRPPCHLRRGPRQREPLGRGWCKPQCVGWEPWWRARSSPERRGRRSSS